MKPIPLNDLAAQLGGDLTCDGDVLIDGIASIEAATPTQLAFLANDKYEKYMEATRAAAVLVSRDYDGPGQRLLRCDDPYFAFRNAMVAMVGFRQPHFDGVDPTASIDPAARLGEGVRVGSGVHVGPGSVIGDRCTLYPNVVVGPGCRLGDDCTLHPNVTLYDGTIVGARVTIHAGSSIGHDGFGFATHKGVHHKIPQAGWVEIGDDVEIGACCAIDRATMGATVIGAGTKFSNLVAIGHGTRLGKGCLVVAQVGIAGSVQVGNYCVLAGQVGVAGHITLGDGVKVGAQAGVTNSLDAGQEYWGTPAQPLAEARRTAVHVQRLPLMARQIKDLARQVEDLQQQLRRLQGGQ